MTDPGNSFFRARNTGFLSGTRTIRETVSDRDRVDFYALRLRQRSAFSSRLSGIAANANADLALFDGNLQRVALSSKPGRQAEAIETVLDRGLYFVKVLRKSGTTRYNLRLSANPFTPPDAGSDIGTATSLSLGSPTTVSNSIGGTDASDVFRIDATSFGNLDLTLSGLSADANLQLLNSSGAVLRSSINSGTAADSIRTSLEAGTYYVRVFPGAGGSTDYSLSAAFNPVQFVGLTDDSGIVSFNSSSTSATRVGITGLAAGESLLGIDFRPATGQLLGVSSASRLYTIDPATGAATAIGNAPLNPAFSGTAAGFDFNPTVDRIRAVSDAEQNLRLNPDTGAIAGVDTLLSYAPTDINAGQNPSITGSAYTGNFAGSTSTTLYSIDSNLNTLVTQGGLNSTPSPNGGQLFTVGSLGIDIAANSGFDIFTDSYQVNTAFATSGANLFRINLATGAATSAGTVSVGSSPVNLIGLAVKP